MARHTLVAILFACASLSAPAADKTPQKPPEKPAETTADEGLGKKLDPAHMKALETALAAKPGETRGKVHTILLPREDIDVRTMDMGEIPAEAGLESRIRLFRCGCGKYYVIGEFCVLEYESNDVIDQLRAGQYRIASVAPMLQEDKPKVLLVRFQGEGKIEEVTKTLKNAVTWIGENRTSHNPVK